jgi:Sulfotransferase family
MVKVNKRRRAISRDDVVDTPNTIGEESGGQQNGHEKRSPTHHFNRSSSSSSFFLDAKKIGNRRPCCHIALVLALLGLLFVLDSNVRNAILNAQITLYFESEMQQRFSDGDDKAGGAPASQRHPQEQSKASSSPEPPPTVSTSSSIQTQQCSSLNGTTSIISFGELVRIHYEKMQQQQQPPALSNTLKFVHIAKTGGTAIEMAAAAANISWGVCHWHNGKYYKHHTCPPSNEPSRVKTGGPPKIAFWHKTSQHYNVRFAATARTTGNQNDLYDPYANATLFAVVRNPYSRIISEYYYETSRGNTPEFVLNNATRLNAWVQQVLRPLQGATMGFMQLVANDPIDEIEHFQPILPPNRNYYQRDSHYIPQYDYFYDGERRVAQHTIHFESLSHEFRALTLQYNLSQTIVLPDIVAPASHNRTSDNNDPEMSGRHTHNKKLGMHNLTMENTRLVEFVYARDFVFFGYPARTHLLENHYQPGDGIAAAEAGRRLEFVHIPQTGGRMIEMAAAAAQIPWGVCHFQHQQSSANGNDQDDELSWCPASNSDDENNNSIQLDPDEMDALLPMQLKGMKNHLWHLPSHYFEKLLSLDPSSPKELHNPYGDDDDNAALFVIVRNPYDRVISTYHSVHEQEEEQMQVSNGVMMMMNNATYMNEWLYRHLVVMRDTISTARNVDATSFPKLEYYQLGGRFMSQYDFVYDFTYDGNQGQRRVVDHVLHFESLATEFPALMNDYYAKSSSRRPVLPEIKDSATIQAVLECTESHSLGIANLTLQNVRLIEFVYARDFAAFGYKSITYHLENQYPPNLPSTNE